MFAPALESEKESAGVVVGFETDVVKSGLRFPLEKLDTVPPPDKPSHDFTAPRLLINTVSFCSNLSFAPPQIVGCALAMPAINSRAKSSVCFFIFVFICSVPVNYSKKSSGSKIVKKPHPGSTGKAACAINSHFPVKNLRRLSVVKRLR